MRPLPLRAPTCKYPAKAIAGRFPIGATYPRHLRPPERGGSPRSGKYALCANIMEVPAVETSAWHLRSVPLRAPTCKYPAKAIAGRFPIGATYPRHLRPPERGGSPRSGKYALCANITVSVSPPPSPGPHLPRAAAQKGGADRRSAADRALATEGAYADLS